ncbi:WD40 repeat domain-containing protein [Fulvivirgaceae bacterium BMA12]|uniref:WD40 repeat domain-containing protein n=1 Tax=Agaribacillus aureus TaxID=3051825 RepID=A0ABT8L955_9BACT|nr:WD40 repeat domain-containing protein [Fulvivirgaceae bacterium BMA12]
MFARIRDLIFGYDICFLHAGNEFSDYVESLANYLSNDNFRCYIHLVNGLDIRDKPARSTIHGSTLLVVLATEEGMQSEFIEKTIEAFIKNRKAVVAIDMGFLKDSRWYYLLKNQKKVVEKPSFLESLKPSNAIYDAVTGAATFRVKNKILKQSNLISASLVVISIFFILGASYYIYYLSDQLTTNRELVNASQLTVSKERENAKLAIEETDKRQNEATVQGKLAYATKMAVKSNNAYASDPTKALRYAEQGYLNFGLQDKNFPSSILSSMYDAFYTSYSLKYAFYQNDIAFTSAVNDFQEIAEVNKLLVASDDGKIRIVNETGEVETTFDAHKRKVNQVTYSPVNQFILTTSDDNTVNLLTINGELIKTLPGHQDDVTFGMISPRGNRLLTITDDSLRIWDNTGNLISTLGEENEIVNYAAFSPVEAIIVTAFGDKIKLLNFQGKTLKEFIGHTDEIIKLGYSINGSRIVSASFDSTAVIWSKQGEMIKRLRGHNGIVNVAAFSPDRTKVVTASDDQTAKLWSWDGRFIKTMAGHADAVVEASFSPNSLYILTVSLDNTIKVWDNKGNHLQTLKAHQGTITKAQFSADSKKITSAAKDGTIKMWPVDSKLLTSMDLHARGVKDVFYGRDEKNIFTLSGRGLVRTWDKNGKMINGNFLNGMVVTQIFTMENGDFLGIINGQVKRLSASGEVKAQWNQLGSDNLQIRVAAGQNNMATLASDNTLKMLSIPKDTVFTFKDSTLVINDFEYSDNKTLILATNKGLATLGDPGQLSWVGFKDQPVRKIIHKEKEGGYLVSKGNGELLLIDDKFQVVHHFPRRFGNITAATSDFDRQIIFASTANGRLLVFRYSGELITSIKLHQAQINRLRLSGDNKYLLTASEDNSAKIYLSIEGIADWLKMSGLASFEVEN